MVFNMMCAEVVTHSCSLAGACACVQCDVCRVICAVVLYCTASQAASAALPVAFGAEMDEDKDVAAVWQEVRARV